MAGTIASGQDFKSISFRCSYTEQSLLHIFLLIVYVIVNFLPQVIFLFLLSLGMVMSVMKLKQSKNKNYLR